MFIVLIFFIFYTKMLFSLLLLLFKFETRISNVNFIFNFNVIVVSF